MFLIEALWDLIKTLIFWAAILAALWLISVTFGGAPSAPSPPTQQNGDQQ